MVETRMPARAEISRRVHRYALVLAAVWTAVMVALGMSHDHQTHDRVLELARARARASFERDQALHLWAATLGGVYVPSSELNPPDPLLAHIPERDITTPSGTLLTLVSHAALLRQVVLPGQDPLGAAGRITGPDPLLPGNAPDAWEQAALQAFQQGETEVSELTMSDGRPTLRLMRPLVAQPSCRRCHTEGIRGGVGVQVPLQPLMDQQRSITSGLLVSFVLVWLVGLGGIVLGAGRVRRAAGSLECAQVELHGAWNKLDATLNALPDLLLEVDRDRVIRDLRCGDPELLPMDPGQLLGRRISEVLGSGESSAIEHTIEEGFSIGISSGVTASFSLPAGQRWFELSAAINGDPKHADSRLIVLAREITKRRQAEEALRASEQKYRTLFENAIDGIALSDPENGLITDCNRALANLVGRSHEEIVGKHLSLLFPQPLVAAANREGDRVPEQMPVLMIHRAVEEQQEQVFEAQIMTADGERKEVEVKANCVELGTSRFLQSIFRDISERRLTEANLERLGMAVEQTSEIILITDWRGTITYVNPAFEQITGYSRTEAIGNNPRMLKSGEQDLSFYRELWRTIANGETWQGRLINRRKDGSLFTEEATISPMRTTTGKIVSYVAVKRDISEKLELEAQLRQSQRMEAIGQLAGGVAHDFNNLLQGMMGFLEVAMAKMPSEGPHSDLTEVMRAGERAAMLTRQLLAFSRRQVLELSDLDLNDVVADLMKLIRRVIGEHITLEVVPGFNLGTVRADRSQIEQALMNLALNARDAMPNGGEITIRAENAVFDQEYCQSHAAVEPGAYVMLSVSDTGCGMDEQTLTRAFEPFFTTKEPGQGTGLGLATVYGIVRQHGGSVECRSDQGRGTTFKIYLPRVEPAAREEKAESQEPIRGGSETILLAEDDEMVRTLSERILSNAGYTVLAAADGEEALELFQHHREAVDMVLLDVVMPKLGGPATLERLHAQRPFLPVLFTSGYLNEAPQSGVISNLGAPFLPKPFAARLLLQMVRSVLDQSSSPTETPGSGTPGTGSSS